MSETKETSKGSKLGLSRPGKLELNKTVETGSVRQSFSHGRSKMVAVEVKKKRVFAQNSDGRMAEVKKSAQPLVEPDVPVVEEAPVVEVEKKPETLQNLTSEERAARLKALEGAREVDKEKRAEAERKALEPKPEPEVESEEVSGKAKDNKAEAAKQEPARALDPADLPPLPSEDDKGTRVRAKKPVKEEKQEVPKKLPTTKRDEPRRRSSGKLTISEALEDQEGRQRSLASVKRKRDRERQEANSARTTGQKVIRDVIITEALTVQELANRMAERTVDVIKALMKMGMMVTHQQVIDADTAELIVEEFGHNFKRVSESDVERGLRTANDDDDESDLVSRAPVVTVMGHVDHGKTSLLDAMRSANVAAGEAGGITQHIGAYQVTTSSGAKISFIDTPGHAAFTEMRARGASVTDIVVLCVAADDGIMPQTIEAIRHAKAAGVPIIVAVNKIDRPDADPARVRTDLLQHDIQVEEMGGDVMAIDVSATQRLNLDKLEEAITLQAEVLDLKSNPNRAAEGVVIEAKMEQGRGSVATVLVQRGTLRIGDILVAGKEVGRVRAMNDALGNALSEAGPAVPVEVLGLNGTPAAGDEVAVVDNEGRAREVAEFRQRRDKNAQAAAGARGSLEQMFERIKVGEAKSLPIVIKGDVHGSVEAINSALNNLATDEVKVHILHSAVGGINESDVTLARASGAAIIGFNVRANPQARDLAKRDGVELRYYSIIYNLLDDLKAVLSGMLAPEVRETFLGNAKIQEVFNVSKVGKVAGCMVVEGMVRKGARVRLIRDETVIHEGELSQLKRFKDDAKEVKEGIECGMAFANYQDMRAGDTIECFDVEEIARHL
ncbi:MAG: translation initiation factor IF-2 [Rhodospirillales bacterium]|nr:translation initiation factor IF-2 [Rhodospirillales bacterium]